MWNLFYGAKHHIPPGYISPKFNYKYVTFMKQNQTKLTIGDSFSNGLIIETFVRISGDTNKRKYTG
jgi:hypothetical protein